MSVHWVQVILLATALILMVLLGNEAKTHSWYDHDCCSEKDCAPVIQSTPGTYAGVTGEMMTTKFGTVFVPNNYKKTRPSRDADTHVCMTAPGTEIETGDTIPSMLICVYRPMMF